MMLAERQQTVMLPRDVILDLPALAPSYPVPAVIAATRRVFVEEGLTLRGEFSGCDHLAIAGRVESDVAMSILDVLDAGSFKGCATVGEAHIAGRYEGALTVAETLVVGPSAHILGVVLCGRLQLEDGGRIEGELRVLAQEEEAAREAEQAAALVETDIDESAATVTEASVTANDELRPVISVEDTAVMADAEATFQAALKKNLCDVAALSGLGHLARQRGDLAAALHYFELIMAADSENISVRCVSIDILRALSRHDEAAAIAKTVMTARPQASTGDEGGERPASGAPEAFDEAEAMFRSVLGRHPRNLGALAGLGHLARRRGDRAAMREYYEAALAVEPMNLNLRVEIARAFKEQGDVAMAREILETVLSEQWSGRSFAST